MPSILARLSPEHIIDGPYPYVYQPDALEPTYYQALAEAFPSLERVAGNGPLGNNQAYLLPAREVLTDPAMPTVWRDFFEYHCSGAFLREVLTFWQTTIAREYPNLEARFKNARQLKGRYDARLSIRL